MQADFCNDTNHGNVKNEFYSRKSHLARKKSVRTGHIWRKRYKRYVKNFFVILCRLAVRT